MSQERALSTNKALWHLDQGLQVSRTGRKYTCVVYITYSVLIWKFSNQGDIPLDSEVMLVC